MLRNIKDEVESLARSDVHIRFRDVSWSRGCVWFHCHRRIRSVWGPVGDHGRRRLSSRCHQEGSRCCISTYGKSGIELGVEFARLHTPCFWKLGLTEPRPMTRAERADFGRHP